MKAYFLIIFVALLALFSTMSTYAQVPASWKAEWPNTDFSRSLVDFNEILSGGPPKDGIPSIDNPQFRHASKIQNISGGEPVIFLSYKGNVKAYPLRVMMWHEIVNDRIGDMPVAVTYCPLCHSAIVFERRVDSKILEFGVSGKLRHSDMIMYDRQTQSWWQQYSGQSITGKMAGTTLQRLPSRVIPFSEFVSGWPEGKVLVPPKDSIRHYGQNPYVGYDTSRAPFLYKGDYDGPGTPLSYLIFVGKDAWLLSDIREAGEIRHENLKIKWRSGMRSALDKKDIASSRDTGFVEVYKKNPEGKWQKTNYEMSFAFAFKEFYPKGKIHTD